MAEIKGRKKAESRKMFFTESIYRQTRPGQHVALGEVGSKPCWGRRMGQGMKDKMMMFHQENRRGTKDGQREHGQTSVHRKIQN